MKKKVKKGKGMETYVSGVSQIKSHDLQNNCFNWNSQDLRHRVVGKLVEIISTVRVLNQKNKDLTKKRKKK